MKNKLLILTLWFALTIQVTDAQVPSYVPANGLVGYYAFNGNANDLSGNGNNGIVSQPTTITEDRFGNSSSAFDFGNTGSVINVPNIGSINFPNDYSISTWVYFRTRNYPNISILGSANFVFYLSAQGATVGQQDSLEFNPSTSPAIGILYTYNVVSMNTWHHVMIVKNLNLISLFLDGVLAYSENYLNVQLNNFSGMSFGNSPSAPISDFNKIDGKIDDIGFWNRALSQQEIANLYNNNLSANSFVNIESLITIYPNPTNSLICVDSSNSPDTLGSEIKIYNTLGQEIYHSKLNELVEKISLGSIATRGLYFVSIINQEDKVITTKKIILN